jgi:hypothetical protein
MELNRKVETPGLGQSIITIKRYKEEDLKEVTLWKP